MICRSCWWQWNSIISEDINPNTQLLRWIRKVLCHGDNTSVAMDWYGGRSKESYSKINWYQSVTSHKKRFYTMLNNCWLSKSVKVKQDKYPILESGCLRLGLEWYVLKQNNLMQLKKQHRADYQMTPNLFIIPVF